MNAPLRLADIRRAEVLSQAAERLRDAGFIQTGPSRWEPPRKQRRPDHVPHQPTGDLHG